MIQRHSSFKPILRLFFCICIGLLALACGGDGESDEGGADVVGVSDASDPSDSEQPPSDVETVEDAGDDVVEPPEDSVEPGDIDDPPEDIVDPPEDVEEDIQEDIKEELTDIPVGDPCGTGIGTCVEGATCIEVEDGSLDKICYEDVTVGNPCGPGLGKCVEGLKCTTNPDGEGKVCLVEKGLGESCNGEGETCAAGQVCAQGGGVESFVFSEAITWQYGIDEWDFSPGPMAYHDDILYVGSSLDNHIKALEDLVLGTSYVETGEENITGLASGSAGLYITRGGSDTIQRMDPNGGTVNVLIDADTAVVEGACMGETDATVVAAADPGAIAKAGHECIVTAECDDPDTLESCVNTCVSGEFGLTEICADCFVSQTLCEVEACEGVCEETDFDCWDTCKAESGCDDGVDTCVNGEEVALPVFGSEGPFDLGFVTTVSGFSLALISDPSNGTVSTFIVSVASGTPWVAWKGLGLGGSDVAFVEPRGIAVGGDQVFVADRGMKAIFVFSVITAGPMFSKLLGAPDETSGEGPLEGPWDVAYDEAMGRLAVTDQDAQRVVIFDVATGEVLNTIDVAGEDPETPPMVMDVLWRSEELLIADAGGKRLLRYSPTYQWLCQLPAGVGETCGMGIAPCSAGLICVPKYEGGTETVCKSPVVPGGDCGGDNTECDDGYTCVTGTAGDGYAQTCLPEAAIGEACGPDIGGCVAGAGCNWDDMIHTNRQCFPNVEIGGVCNIYGVGDCVTGSTCLQELIGSTTLVCKENVGIFASCGQGIASCHPWLSCHYSDSVVNRACYPFQKEGDPCGLGMGNCESGTFCNFPDLDATSPVCIANQKVGEACGIPGLGLCDEDEALCVPMSAGGLNNMCLAKETGPNEACGQYGLPPCIDGTNCIIDGAPPNNVSASCYSDKSTEGASCGAGHGGCDSAVGLGCLITNSPEISGFCAPLQPDFASCGDSTGGLGACALLGGACVCNDPFVQQADCPETDFVCVPGVGLYDTCAVNSVIPDPVKGWVGLCPGNMICSVKDGTGAYYLYMCKPIASAGEPCGLLHACGTGLTCTCAAGACTLTEIMSGDVGTCQVGG